MNEPISAYPLSWPRGWRRTAAGSRKRGQFKHYRNRVSVWDGVERCLAELERLDVSAEDAIISTNVPTRLDGRPRSDKAEPQDPGVAVYWRARQNEAPKVMAIDIYDRVADNLAAIAATLEAMRAIERHGGAQILERVFEGFAQLPAPGQAKPWRQVLGVADLCRDLGLIKPAYQKLAAQNHPDRGGDSARMAEINCAWEQAQQELAS